jgi:hypothetical protein
VTRRADPDLVLAALPPGLRAAVVEFAAMFGADSFEEVPPLRQLATYAAALRLAGDMEGLSATDALAAACELLGLEDDADRATRPSDSIARQLRRWARGQFVRARLDDAA